MIGSYSCSNAKFKFRSWFESFLYKQAKMAVKLWYQHQQVPLPVHYHLHPCWCDKKFVTRNRFEVAWGVGRVWWIYPPFMIHSFEVWISCKLWNRISGVLGWISINRVIIESKTILAFLMEKEGTVQIFSWTYKRYISMIIRLFI